MKPALLKILYFYLLLPLFATPATSEDDCVYTVYIRTGSIFKGGTDSRIGLKLYDSYGYGLRIKELEAWGGLMDVGHDYFERGNLDIFSGRGACLNGRVCAVNLTSDGSGAHHGWLALDAWPYTLWAYRDFCSNKGDHGSIRSGFPA